MHCYLPAGRKLRIAAKICLVLLCAMLFGVACSGSNRDLLDNSANNSAPASDNQNVDSEVTFPIALPADRQQPWEQLDGSGLVIPQGSGVWLSDAGRAVSGINAQSEFIPGAQRDSEQGSVSTLGLASSFSSGTAGSGDLSYAFYRLPLGAEQPGAASIDVNLKLVNGGSALSDCWAGFSDYSRGVWEWHRVTDSGSRISLSGTDYTSPLGSFFVAIVAFSGAQFDLVGIGVNPADGADSTAPPVPGGLTATAVAGGLELQWNSVLAGDLAGYRIYYSNSAFASAGSPGVKKLDGLEGGLRHLLGGLSGVKHVRISAVDISGNESALSTEAVATPLPGTALTVQLLTDVVSGGLDSPATLTASGASSYDFDTDGDGVFDITGSASGSASIDTSRSGIIRPAVRASSGSGVAHGSVSLIIAANLPPVAILSASDYERTRWANDPAFNVTLEGASSIDEDAGSLQFAFDPEGDGSFTADQAGTSLGFTYTVAGSYLAALRVTDSQGLQSYSSAMITLHRATDWDANYVTFDDPPGIDFVGFTTSAIVSGNPAITYLDSRKGICFVRANDPEGRSWPAPFVVVADVNARHPDMAVIGGRPAIAFSSAGLLYYIRAANGTGGNQSAWSNPPVNCVNDAANVFAADCSLTEVSGRPAIAFRDELANFDVFYIRASNASGDTLADWANPYTLASVSGSALNMRVDLIVAGGNPAVMFTEGNQLYYKRSTSNTGNVNTDWTAVAFDIQGAGGGANGSGLSAAVINGNPAVAFYDNLNQPYRLRYVRASNTTGATQGDWPDPLTIDQGSGAQEVGIFCSLADVNGRPAISYSSPFLSNTTIFFRRALDDTGASWGAPQLVDGGIGNAPGSETSLVCANGWAGIAHCDANTITNLLLFSSVNIE